MIAPGFALGLIRAGWLGALAAFTAFTLPSAIILVLFAMTAAAITVSLGTGALHGLEEPISSAASSELPCLNAAPCCTTRVSNVIFDDVCCDGGCPE
jgi:hypothetical protein